jgi:hypothetical protein
MISICKRNNFDFAAPTGLAPEREKHKRDEAQWCEMDVMQLAQDAAQHTMVADETNNEAFIDKLFAASQAFHQAFRAGVVSAFESLCFTHDLARAFEKRCGNSEDSGSNGIATFYDENGNVLAEVDIEYNSNLKFVINRDKFNSILENNEGDPEAFAYEVMYNSYLLPDVEAWEDILETTTNKYSYINDEYMGNEYEYGGSYGAHYSDKSILYKYGGRAAINDDGVYNIWPAICKSLGGPFDGSSRGIINDGFVHFVIIVHCHPPGTSQNPSNQDYEAAGRHNFGGGMLVGRRSVIFHSSWKKKIKISIYNLENKILRGK